MIQHNSDSCRLACRLCHPFDSRRLLNPAPERHPIQVMKRLLLYNSQPRHDSWLTRHPGKDGHMQPPSGPNHHLLGCHRPRSIAKYHTELYPNYLGICGLLDSHQTAFLRLLSNPQSLLRAAAVADATSRSRRHVKVASPRYKSKSLMTQRGEM